MYFVCRVHGRAKQLKWLRFTVFLVYLLLRVWIASCLTGKFSLECIWGPWVGLAGRESDFPWGSLMSSWWSWLTVNSFELSFGILPWHACFSTPFPLWWVSQGQWNVTVLRAALVDGPCHSLSLRYRQGPLPLPTIMFPRQISFSEFFQGASLIWWDNGRPGTLRDFKSSSLDSKVATALWLKRKVSKGKVRL